MKWYEEKNVDDGIVISSRVRLARNIKKYPFPKKISQQQSKTMIEELKGSLLNERTQLGSQFKYAQVNKMTANEKRAMMESHTISPVLVAKAENCGVLIKDDETVSIMLNEEDHVRIQTIFAGENIDKAWDLADKIDNLIEESVEYAFDEGCGYITSCPTNMGTGLRASFMIHVPALEGAGQMQNLVNALGKFGITVRGIYGEGTDAVGSIYQISNQITLGQSEDEIIKNLKNAVNFVKEQEIRFRENLVKNRTADLEDDIYRAYGIAANARKISAKEAMGLLSKIREGFILGILEVPKPQESIYNVMINIQQGNIQNNFITENNANKRDEVRANYLRDVFNQ